MANRYRDPEPCDFHDLNGQCGVAETRRFLNGWLCARHTPYALRGAEEPKGTRHLYTPMTTGIRHLDWNGVIQQNKRKRIDSKRQG